MDGLIVAKTYLEVNASAKIVILDSSQSIGGVWAKERVYPGLKTNHAWGAYEFSDFPMTGYGLKADDHIPGLTMHRYLVDFAEYYDLAERTRLNTYVAKVISRGASGWALETQEKKRDTRLLHAAKLVLATGLSSAPSLPQLPGSSAFGKPYFHTRDLAKQEHSLQDVASIAVLGGGKSAMDVAHHYSSRGVKVHWLIRKSGHGPKWTSPIRATPFKIRTDKLVNCRLISWFSPCIWAVDGFSRIRNFLHRTRLGRILVGKFMKDMQKGIIKQVGYDKHPNTSKSKPWNHLFWHGAQISTLDFDSDVMALARKGQIEVHVADIDRLSAGIVHMDSGTELAVDALVCATGWKYKPVLAFEGVSEDELGLPLNVEKNSNHIRRANAEIDEALPFLKDPPIELKYPDALDNVDPVEPFRLCRFSVPPKLLAIRNIAFSGLISTVSTCAMTQAQALWITAFFNDQLPTFRLPTDTDARAKKLQSILYETVLHTQFMKRRTSLGGGPLRADMSPDSVPFLDVLFRDLGLPIWRKNSLLREMFVGYVPQDYRGLVQEWLQNGLETRSRQGEPLKQA